MRIRAWLIAALVLLVWAASTAIVAAEDYVLWIKNETRVTLRVFVYNVNDWSELIACNSWIVGGGPSEVRAGETIAIPPGGLYGCGAYNEYKVRAVFETALAPGGSNLYSDAIYAKRGDLVRITQWWKD